MTHWKCVEPILNDHGHSIWLGVTTSGNVVEINTKEHTQNILCTMDVSLLDADKEWMLRMAAHEPWVAIAEMNGQHGIVFDRYNGETKLRLDRGDYRNAYHSKFSFVFVPWENEDVLIHATSWNRLDVTRVKDNVLLTPRETSRDQHYYDYFHGNLHLSPDQKTIIDNGWVWHPVGVLTQWNVAEWLTTNPYLSEHPTHNLPATEIMWDRELCFINNDTLAIWGRHVIEDDSASEFISAISIIDCITGAETFWFSIPSDGELFYSDALFQLSKEHGISKWDPRTGQVLAQNASFVADRFHASTHEFLKIEEDGSFSIQTL